MSNPLVRKLRHNVMLVQDDEAALDRLVGHVYSTGSRQDIVAEGKPPGALTLILEGWACRYKILPNGRRHIITFFLPGDLCEPFQMLPGLMDHSLGTLSPVSYARILTKDALAATRQHPNVEKALWWDMLFERAILYERTVSLGRRSALERLGHLICEFHCRLAIVGLATGNSFDMPLTQGDLADALGVSDVHLNRSLQSLRAAGLLTLRERRVQIHDLAGLQEASLFDPFYLHPERQDPN